jgi:hypothetical protein
MPSIGDIAAKGKSFRNGNAAAQQLFCGRTAPFGVRRSASLHPTACRANN